MVNKKNKKISIIGGGSRSWCIEIVLSLLDSEIKAANIYLYDIVTLRAEQNVEIFRKYIKHMKLEWKVDMETNLESAIKDSDVIIISIIPDNYKKIKRDLLICENYGLKQTSGDTVGPAGFFRGLKCVPIFTEYAKIIRERAKDALVLNFTNPLVLSTQTLYKEYPDIKALGFCPEFLYSQVFYKKICAKILNNRIDDDYWEYSAIGLNHFIWVNRMNYKGKSMIDAVKKYFQENSFLNLDSTERIIKSIVQKYDGLPGARMEYFLEFLPYNDFLGNKEIVGQYFSEKNLIEVRMKSVSKSQEFLNDDKFIIDYLKKRVTYCYRKDVCIKCNPINCWRSICKKIPKIIEIICDHKDDSITYNTCIATDKYGHVKELQISISKDAIIIENNEDYTLSNSVQKLIKQQMIMVDNIIQGVRECSIEDLKEAFCNDNMLMNIELSTKINIFDSLMESRYDDEKKSFGR